MELTLQLVIFWIFQFFYHSESIKLNRDGLNVCSRLYSYNSYYTSTMNYIGYDNYRTCCKRFIWCVSRCTKYRTRIRYQTVSKLRVKYSTSLFCCPGWARKGNECPVAMCYPSCKNGDCIAPNVCKCRAGFKGKYCEEEINECRARPSPCDQVCLNLRGSYACSCKRGFRKLGTSPQSKGCENVNECAASSRLCKCAIVSPLCKATCQDTIGSYRCQCNAGFRLINNKICTDVDECQAGSHGCQQICLNARGGYKCACRKGYWLRSDGRRCYDLNECRRANGGCEQTCTNTDGSYHCGCRAGYRLAYGGHRCSDVDECITIRPCDRFHGKCENMYGSYRCLCEKGYELQADGKSCSDIDECQRINDCRQNCHNTDGSYFCSCRRGYRLGSNNRNCKDINECTEGLHNCDQICYNVIGSYTCKCRPGFILQPDKRRCRALPCKKLYNPHHGKVNCNGNNVGDVCVHTCNPGYEVQGSQGNARRVCQQGSRWSGGAVRCVPMTCPAARPPQNAVLVLPCVEEYKSECLVKCKHGYYMSGNATIKCGLDGTSARWNFNNARCQGIKLCLPNPCQHGGSCTILSNTEYTCDCSGTGYTGDNCQTGIVTLPQFPQLAVNEESGLLTLLAKPADELTITPEPQNGNIEFRPAKLVVKHPRTLTSFKIIPKSEGLVRIKYTLSGKDRAQFAQPADSLIYVTTVKKTDQLTLIPDVTFTKLQCKTKDIDKCSDGRKIQLLSTCPWEANGTVGYQSVAVTSTKFPLSLAGINLPPAGLSQWSYRTSGVLTVTRETNAMLKTGRRFCSVGTACPNSFFGPTEHKFLIQRNIFTRSSLQAVSAITPKWFNIKLPADFTGFHVSNIQSIVIKGHRRKDLPVCVSLPKSISGTYAVHIINAPVSVQMLSKRSKLSSPYPTCLAVDICKKISYASFPKDSHVDLTPDLKSFGILGMDVKVMGLGLSITKSIQDNCAYVWDASVATKSQMCSDSKIWAKTVASFERNQMNITLDGEARLGVQDISKTLINKFSTPTKLSFRGNVLAFVTMKVGGKKLKLHLRNKNGKLFANVGGPSPYPCLLCSKSGLYFESPSPLDFTYETSLLTFHPKQSKGSSHFLRILYNLNGGRITAVANGARLRLMVRVLSRSLPISIRGLLVSLRSRRTTYPAEMGSLTSFVTKITTFLTTLLQIVSQANPDYQNVYDHLQQLRQEVSSIKDILYVINERIKALETNARIKMVVVARIRFLQRSLKQATDLNAIPTATKVTEQLSGYSFGYSGKICFYALCFDNTEVTAHDLLIDSNDWRKCSGCSQQFIQGFSPDTSVLIIGKFKADQVLGRFLRVTKGTIFKAAVDKSLGKFSIRFMAGVKIFSTSYNTEIEINEGKVSFEIKDTEISSELKFDLTVSADNSERSRWETLYFSVNGLASSTSKLAQNLEAAMTEFIVSTANKTKLRLKKASDKISDAHNDVVNQRKNVPAKLAMFHAAQKGHRDAKTSYLRGMSKYNETLIRFRSYRIGQYFSNLGKALNDTCKFMQCKTICLSVPSCDICQDPVYVDADTLRCDSIDRKIRTTVEEPLSTDCQLTKYRFTPIYTGTCKKGKSGVLTGALTGVGAGVGFLVGGPVGGLIGGAIGFFASMFSSCDQSYEVYKEAINYQVPCTRKTFNTRTKTWVEAECFTVIKNVLSGYDNPKECNCNNDTCTPVQDPICMQLNNECRTNRTIMVRRTLESAGVYNDTFTELQNARKTVEQRFLKMLSAERSLTEARRLYEKEVALVKQSELESTLANRSLVNAKESLALEQCISDVYARSKNVRPITDVKKITFKAVPAAVENLLFEVTVAQTGEIRYKQFVFLFDFADSKLSLHRGVRRMTRDMFCAGKSRRRRSADANTVEYKLGKSAFLRDLGLPASVPENVTEAQTACLVSNTIFGFLNHIFKELVKSASSAESRKLELDSSSRAAVKMLAGRNLQSKDATVAVQNQVLKKMKTQIVAEQSQLSATIIRTKWLKDMAVYTAGNNFTKCLGLEDCVEQALEDLKELPSLLTVDRATFLQLVNKVETDFKSLLSSNLQSLSSLRFLAKGLNRSFKNLKQVTQFCAKAPQVTLNTPDQIITTVGSDSSITIKCLVTNTLNVRYNWIFNNATLPSENGPQLTVNAEKQNEGSYQCQAISLSGKNISEETYVIIRGVPKFIDQPKDFKYHSSLDKAIKPFFLCNVSSDPPANISWHFETFTAPEKSVNLGQNKPVLTLADPTAADGGYYYCKASNEHGNITSRKARLDILAAQVPNQALAITFDLQFGRGESPDKSQLEQQVKQQGNFSNTQQVNVTLEYKAGRDVSLEIKVTGNLRESGRSGGRQLSDIEILRRVSSARQSLSNGLQNYLTKLSKNRGRSASEKMEKTMKLGFQGDLCPMGYQLHSNGFTCVECEAGTFEHNGKCHLCPIGKYQGLPGKSNCVSCKENEVTKESGATGKEQCTPPELKATDVIFVLDSSGSIRWHNWQKVKQFVVHFVQEFVNEKSNIKVGIVTYSSRAYVTVPLQSYSKTDLIKKANNLAYIAGWTRTYDALSLAGTEFSRQVDKNRKRIAFVMTDGKSTSFARRPGFIFTRNQAIKLQRKAVHIVSVGVGSGVERNELLAMASYPKKANLLQFDNFNALIKAARRISATALKGQCTLASKDIAVVIERSSRVGNPKWIKTKEFLVDLLLKTTKSSATKVSLFSFAYRLQMVRSYSSYTSVADIQSSLDGVPDISDDPNFPLVLSKMYNTYFNERQSSLSPTKILLLVTRRPFDFNYLRQLQRDYPDEKIELLNLVMNYKSYDEDLGSAPIGSSGQVVFSLSQLSKLTKAIQAARITNASCKE